MTPPAAVPRFARPLVGLVVTAVIAGLASCATSPTGRRQLKLFPDEQIAAMGARSFQSLKQDRPVSQDPAVDGYVLCVADALIAELAPQWQSGWEVVVFEDRTANAFALPGRKIGVHTGLLAVARNQDQLATVIGHEIGHVLASHGNERVSQEQLAQIGMATVAAMTDPNSAAGRSTLAALGLGAQYGILLPFSRSHETEADAIGLDLMARAGFEPSESVRLWQNMAAASGGRRPPEWMSTPPSNRRRIDDLSLSVPAANRLRDAARKAGKRPSCTPAGG